MVVGTGASLSASGSGTITATDVANAAVIAKTLTGYTVGAGTVVAADSILAAIQKLDGNVGGKVAKAGDTMTGAFNYAATQTIVSAGTTNIAGATSNSIIVTGTTTITALGTIAAGAERVVQFSGALTLTHNATSLILPGGASITTAAGDVAYFVSLGAGNWRCTGYQKANGNAVVGGSGDFKSDGTVAMTGAIATSVGTMTSSVANGASAKAFSFNTSGAYTTTAKLASWSNNSVEKVYFVQDGGVFADNFCPSGPSGPNTNAKIYGGGNQSIKVKTNNQDVLYLSGQGNYVQTVSDAVFSWTPSTDITVGPDTALARDVAGRVSVLKSRTASDYGDLKVRNAILTGNLALGIVAKTANYTVTANDHTIECDATSGAITLTLPAVSGAQAGTQYTLKKTDASANAVTFDGNASETIDGATTVSTTTQWASITIRRNAAGTAWITTKD